MYFNINALCVLFLQSAAVIKYFLIAECGESSLSWNNFSDAYLKKAAATSYNIAIIFNISYIFSSSYFVNRIIKQKFCYSVN